MGVTDRLNAYIGRHPRVALGHFPTPLEPLHRLTSWVGGPKLYVKRDDASGMGQGGNKVRALEFIIPQALELQADILLTMGVVQSNSVRQVAAAAAKFGISCHYGMITDRVSGMDADYAETGNFFLNHLYGATHEVVSINDDRVAVLNSFAERFRALGCRPYVVPYGCASRLGAVGYLQAAVELYEQSVAMQVPITHVVHASGTGGTQAGLIAGFAAMGIPVDVIGIDIDADEAGVRRRVTTILDQLSDDLRLDRDELRQKIIVESRFAAGAYGRADAATVETIRAASRLEALTVDPVYAGKGLTGVVGLARKGRFSKNDHVVFLHTGGTPAIYAYRSLFGFEVKHDPAHRAERVD